MANIAMGKAEGKQTRVGFYMNRETALGGNDYRRKKFFRNARTVVCQRNLFNTNKAAIHCHLLFFDCGNDETNARRNPAGN